MADNNSIISVGTFFSGIGSPEKALKQLKEEKVINDFKIEFFSEIDKNAIKSYCEIHNIDGSLNLGDITNIKGEDLPYCDLWIGGFPCQDISCAGKMNGFDASSSTRSSLGWQMIRLLKEVKEKPKYVIFENVAMIASKKFRNTLDLFKNDLKNLGYSLYDKVLNANDYGIPQNRKRYFLIAVLENSFIYNFPDFVSTNIVLKDFLEENVNEKYYLSNNDYREVGSKRIFFRKDNNGIEYEIDMDKLLNGGVCGKDKHSKYAQSSRIFSIYGNAPTLTASNTADNCKIVVENEVDLYEN